VRRTAPPLVGYSLTNRENSPNPCLSPGGRTTPPSRRAPPGARQRLSAYFDASSVLFDAPHRSASRPSRPGRLLPLNCPRCSPGLSYRPANAPRSSVRLGVSARLGSSTPRRLPACCSMQADLNSGAVNKKVVAGRRVVKNEPGVGSCGWSQIFRLCFESRLSYVVVGLVRFWRSRSMTNDSRCCL